MKLNFNSSSHGWITLGIFQYEILKKKPFNCILNMSFTKKLFVLLKKKEKKTMTTLQIEWSVERDGKILTNGKRNIKKTDSNKFPDDIGTTQRTLNSVEFGEPQR